jgi:hypothetical protein
VIKCQLKWLKNTFIISSSGDSLIVGDWKLLKVGNVNPSQEYGWQSPPGEDTSTTTYSINCNGTQPSVVLAKQCTQSYCLFNLAEDPCEYSDVSRKYPDKVAELTARLETFQVSAIEVGTSGPCNATQVTIDGITAWTYGSC